MRRSVAGDLHETSTLESPAIDCAGVLPDNGPVLN
jgi:hypothetical protein